MCKHPLFPELVNCKTFFVYCFNTKKFQTYFSHTLWFPVTVLKHKKTRKKDNTFSNSVYGIFGKHFISAYKLQLDAYFLCKQPLVFYEGKKIKQKIKGKKKERVRERKDEKVSLLNEAVWKLICLSKIWCPKLSSFVVKMCVSFFFFFYSRNYFRFLLSFLKQELVF